MTPIQFFKLYPDAQAAWQVGNDLYFEGYESSARQRAQRIGAECKRITRQEAEGPKVEKAK